MQRNEVWVRILPDGTESPCFHSYSWSGSMPCTGVYKCVFCGKPENENTFNGKGTK